MMKHVQLSPFRSRADTVSLSSTTSYGSLSPEPLGSRSSSYSSLNDTDRRSSGQTTIKVYAKCLRPDIEYKTLGITFQTTCKEVVGTLLNKYKMKHRDPKLFYLSMEVTVRKDVLSTYSLPLDDGDRPAALQSCHLKGDSKFSLQTRRGGLVKVYDSDLNTNSLYKSLLISARTTVDELIALLLNCYNNKERVEQFSLYEVNPDKEQKRKLHPDDRPLQVQQIWLPSHKCHFSIKRNPDYLPLSRRKMFWVTDRPPLPVARLFQTTSMNFPKPSTSLVPISQKPEDKTKKQSQLRTDSRVLTKSTDLKIFDSKVCNSQIATKKDGTPNYADYENYFYI